MLACLWKLAAKAIGNDVILTEQHQIRKRREKMGFSKRLCFRALRLFRAPRGENLSTSQKDGTIALFQETYHILDWFGFVTHFPGNPENGGEACSGCVCLSWASSDRTVLNRDRETEKSLWEQRFFFSFSFFFPSKMKWWTMAAQVLSSALLVSVFGGQGLIYSIILILSTNPMKRLKTISESLIIC